MVAAAWRGRTDWYRNLQAAPALEVRVGRVRFAPEQRLRTPDETFRELQGYAARHPVAARLAPWLFGIDLGAPEAVVRAQATAFFKGVRFRPKGGPPRHGAAA